MAARRLSTKVIFGYALGTMTKTTILRALLTLAIGIAFVACASDSDSKPDPKKKKLPPAAKKQPVPAPAPPPPKKEEKPEPTTPEEIEQARKEALLEGREKDAIKYCEMAGLEAGKSDPQALLGCAIAACRIKEEEKANAWTKGMEKALLNEARRICSASGVLIHPPKK